MRLLAQPIERSRAVRLHDGGISPVYFHVRYGQPLRRSEVGCCLKCKTGLRCRPGDYDVIVDAIDGKRGSRWKVKFRRRKRVIAVAQSVHLSDERQRAVEP